MRRTVSAPGPSAASTSLAARSSVTPTASTCDMSTRYCSPQPGRLPVSCRRYQRDDTAIGDDRGRSVAARSAGRCPTHAGWRRCARRPRGRQVDGLAVGGAAVGVGQLADPVERVGAGRCRQHPSRGRNGVTGGLTAVPTERDGVDRARGDGAPGRALGRRRRPGRGAAVRGAAIATELSTDITHGHGHRQHLAPAAVQPADRAHRDRRSMRRDRSTPAPALGRRADDGRCTPGPNRCHGRASGRRTR